MENWYYEYDVTVEEDGLEVFRRGVVCNNSFSAVSADIENYYGTSLIRINKIACISDILYQFNNEDAEFKIHVEA